jgi:hypothetical protein
MAAKIITEEFEEFDEPKIRASVRNKSGGPRLVLMEEKDADALDDKDVPHSGIIDKDGNNVYNESPIRGGRILTFDGKLINNKGHEIDKDGKVLNPEKYRIETDFQG